MAKVSALIPCAGQGKRMGGAVSKPYIEVCGRPLLSYTLDRFEKHPLIDEIIVITHVDMVEFCKEEVIFKYGMTKVKTVVAGGEERQDSVFKGLAALNGKKGWVVVHDGVRPLLSSKTLTLALETAFQKGNAVVGVPVKDTIKRINPDLTIAETPDRQTLWQVQTPQVFPAEVLAKAHCQAARTGWRGTDDASLVERLGVQVHMVKGEYTNIKVTTPEDLLYVKELMRMD